jgi:hypothetical protein
MSTHAGGGSHNDAPRVLGAAVLNVGRLLEHACRHRADCPVRAAYSQVKLSASSLAARATVICALGSPRSSFFLNTRCFWTQWLSDGSWTTRAVDTQDDTCCGPAAAASPKLIAFGRRVPRF